MNDLSDMAHTARLSTWGLTDTQNCLLFSNLFDRSAYFRGNTPQKKKKKILRGNSGCSNKRWLILRENTNLKKKKKIIKTSVSSCQMQSRQIQIIDLDFFFLPSIEQLTKKQSVRTGERGERRGLTSRSAGNIQTWIHTCCQSCWWANVNDQPLTSSLTFRLLTASYFFFSRLANKQKKKKRKKKAMSYCATARGGRGGWRELCSFWNWSRLIIHTLCVEYLSERRVPFFPPAGDTPPPCTGARKTSMAAHYRQQPIRAQGDSCAPSSPPLPRPPDDDSSRWTLSLGNGQERYCMMLLICSLQGNKVTSLILYFFLLFFFFEWETEIKNTLIRPWGDPWHLSKWGERHRVGRGGEVRGGEGAHLPGLIHKYIPRATQCLHVSVTMNCLSAGFFFLFKSTQEDTCVHTKPDSLTDVRNDVPKV